MAQSQYRVLQLQASESWTQSNTRRHSMFFLSWLTALIKVTVQCTKIEINRENALQLQLLTSRSIFNLIKHELQVFKTELILRRNPMMAKKYTV